MRSTKFQTLYLVPLILGSSWKLKRQQRMDMYTLSQIQLQIYQDIGQQVSQYDENGNSTIVSWSVPNPFIIVNLTDQTVFGVDWTKSTQVEVDIDGTKFHGMSDGRGFFIFENIGLVLPPGQTVTATDGKSTRTHKVYKLAIKSIDPATDTVYGTGEPFSKVRSHIGSFYGWADIDANGEWSISSAGKEDITIGTRGYASITDEYNNSTEVFWFIPNPRIYVSRTSNTINCYGCPQFENVSLTFRGETLLGITDAYGSVEFKITPALKDGEKILLTLEDGRTTLTYSVQPLYVAGFNSIKRAAEGTASPGAEIFVYICNEYCIAINPNPVSDSSGHWLALVPSGFEILPTTRIYASVQDVYGNGTGYDYEPQQLFLPTIMR